MGILEIIGLGYIFNVGAYFVILIMGITLVVFEVLNSDNIELYGFDDSKKNTLIKLKEEAKEAKIAVPLDWHTVWLFFPFGGIIKFGDFIYSVAKYKSIVKLIETRYDERIYTYKQALLANTKDK